MQQITPYQYQLSVSYNWVNRLIYIEISNVLYFFLTRFTYNEIQQLFPHLALYRIGFWDHLKAILKEALAIVFIRLFYLV